MNGSECFLLWESFGFPNDLTEIMAEEIGMKVDWTASTPRSRRRRRSPAPAGRRPAGRQLLFEAEATAWLSNNAVPLTDDAHKYDVGANPTATVKAILTLDGFKDSTEGVEGPVGLVLDRTSFYAESGGQVADVGSIKCASGTATVSDVKVAAGYVMHVAEAVEGASSVGDACDALVDYERRSNIAPNHGMTHVLNYALRAVLGDGVDQKGSLVDDEKLRFDFSHTKAMTVEQIKRVEAIVRDMVGKKLAVDTREVPLAQAQAISGLRAVFGEVYPDPVRVVSVGPAISDLLSDPSNDDWKAVLHRVLRRHAPRQHRRRRRFRDFVRGGHRQGYSPRGGCDEGAAAAANAAADEVAARVKACDGLAGAELAKEMATLKGVVDTAIMPATRRAVIRDAMTAITKR